MDALGAKISEIIGLARSLFQWVSAAAGMGVNQNTGIPLSGAGADLLPPSPGQMESSPRPARPDVNSHGDWLDARKPKGGGGKGGGKKLDDDQKEALRIFQDTRTEAERLVAEMEKLDRLKGKGLIDVDTFERAKDELQGVADLGPRIHDALSGAFAGIFDDPKQAMKELAAEFLKMAIMSQMLKSFPGTFGKGGPLNFMATAMGFDRGGYTGAGGVHEPAGIVHRGEVVWSQRDVARAGGVAAVEGMRRGVRGYAMGGAVGATAPGSVGGGAPIIHLHNEGAPAEVSRVQQSKGPNARDQFDIWLNESLANGKAARGLKANGVRKPPVVR